MTYDNAEVLKEFGERFHVTYPLLSDPRSEVIRRFGILDPDNTPANLPPDGKTGVAYPGFFYVTPAGIIKEKYFGDKYYDRFTANNVLLKLFPELKEPARGEVSDEHIRVELTQSDQEAVIGSRVTLAARVHLPIGMHVYAPGTTDYKPVQLALTTEGLPLKDAAYPKPELFHFTPLNETVPVYTGTFEIRQDVLVILDPKLRKQYLKFEGGRDSGALIPIEGELLYQACTDSVCFAPARLPLHWTLRIHQMDNQRSPEAIRDRRQK